MRILDRLFKREEIDGNGRCPTYLIRWTLFQPRRPKKFWRGFGVYIHKFVGDDWSLDLHDHPKRFISIGLRGEYIEDTPRFGFIHPFQPLKYVEDGCTVCGWPRARHDAVVSTPYRAPWIRTFPAYHVHRLRLVDRRPCWTLVIVLAHVREWGFWHQGIWRNWRGYVDPKNPIADEMKSCR